MDVIILDCVGMRCPMPIVQLGRAAQNARPGTQIEVTSDDAAFYSDVCTWAEIRGCKMELLETENESHVRVRVIL
jgi:tRNA 2-thiouridine synthesizing protein A